MKTSVTEVNSIPLLADQEIPAGTQILIPKGTEWKSTHPQLESGVMKRDMKIKVQTSSSKWTDQLTWAGTGGYWRWCKKVDCSMVS